MSVDQEEQYSLESKQQFWDELGQIIKDQCETQQHIDTRLRSYLQFISDYQDEYLESESDLAECAFKLLECEVFLRHRNYVRRRLVGRFIKEPPNSAKLHVIAFTLLYDGKEHQKTFELMVEQNAFPRLIQLMQKDVDKENHDMHKLLLELFYEMGRIQPLRIRDLESIEDDFIKHILGMIEEGTTDPDDPYNYAIIRVLLVLNEQYMLSEHNPIIETRSSGLTNRVLKVLSYDGPDYKSFGENIILLLNRESETSLQLLILKIMYLLFTTSRTYEYFYTNDLCVLVDVMIRNLSDLADDDDALRHTYLRVLYPLLSHTQLRHPPHYKRNELITLLRQLSNVRSQHFSPVDPTTLRLVQRCNKVEWLEDKPIEEKAQNLAQRLIGMSLEGAGSSMSVVEIAALKERPGVQTRSKTTATGRRPPPPPPPPSRNKRGVWGGLESEKEDERPVILRGATTSQIVEVGNGGWD